MKNIDCEGRTAMKEKLQRTENHKRPLHLLQLLNIFDYLTTSLGRPSAWRTPNWGGGGGVNLPQNVRVDCLECALHAAPHELVLAFPFHVF
jgi:hypothetical protein